MKDRHERILEDICFRCGECCRRFQVLLDRPELERLADFLAISPQDFIGLYSDSRWPGQNNWLLKQRSGACPFLKDGIREYICAIHSVKPGACREWAAAFSKPECKRGLERFWHLTLINNQLQGNPENISAFEKFLESL